MRFSTYTCMVNPHTSASVMGSQVTLGGPNAEDALIIQAPREERLELLAEWAKAEGCELGVGNAIERRVTIPAGYYDGPSGSRTGD